MSFYGFLPPFGRDSSAPSGSTASRNAGEFNVGDIMHVPWAIKDSSDVTLSILHENDPDSTGYTVGSRLASVHYQRQAHEYLDDLPFSTNFTWTIDAKALYSNTSTGHDFIFSLQLQGRSLTYTSFPFTIHGDLPTSPPPTVSLEPTPTASAPAGHLETLTPQPSGPSPAALGLIATAIVLGAAVLIGGAMAFIFRKSLKRRLRLGKKSRGAERQDRPEAGPHQDVAQVNNG